MEPEALSNGRQSAQSHPGASAAGGDIKPSVSVPDHKLLRCIGRGSYGEVWLAQSTMGMYRAVKLVHRKSFRDQRPFERELSGIRKYEPISRSYEGFIDVLHVGINEEHGCFYYVMELGDDEASGQKIDPDNYSPKTLGKEIAANQKLSTQDCLQLGLALCQALWELHKHSLVHRDIKPSNIIFVNGVPKLADIGLVADFNEARSYVGTEGFIPPEGPGTPQADIYSLGKVLYEAGTGKDRHDFPELPTLVEEFPDRDKLLELNEVILKACQNDVSKRYGSAWDMYGDLLVLANGASVKRLRLLERRLSNLKRIAGIAALAFVVIAIISLIVYREWRNVTKARENLVAANIEQGNRALEAGVPQQAMVFFADAFRFDKRNPDGDLAHRLRFNSALARTPRLTHLWVTSGGAQTAKFSPDGQKLLVAETYGYVSLYDLKTDQVLVDRVKVASWILSIDFSPDGQRIVIAGGADKIAYVCDATLHVEHTLKGDSYMMSAQFTHDCKVLTASYEGEVQLWNPQTEKVEQRFNSHTGKLRFAGTRNDGKLFVTAGEDQCAHIWNAETANVVGSPFEHRRWAKHAALSPDHRLMASASSDHTAKIWEVGASGAGHREYFIVNHDNEVQNAEFSPDGRMLVTASLDCTARICRIEDLSRPDATLILRHGSGVNFATFSPDSRSVATVCADGTIWIRDLAGIIKPPLPVHTVYSHDGSKALVLTPGAEKVQNTLTGETIGRPEISGRPDLLAEFSPNGNFVASVKASAVSDYAIKIWNVTNSQPLSPEISISDAARDIFTAVSDDGKRVAVAFTNVIKVWDVASATTILQLTDQANVVGLLFSKDGNRLISLSGKSVRVCEVSTGKNVFAPLDHDLDVKYAEYSSDGQYLVTCCGNERVAESYAQVWDAASGRPAGPRLVHPDGVIRASFSPDNRSLATACENYKGYVWNWQEKKLLTPPLEHKDQVMDIRYSPDGKWIVTLCGDKTARVWESASGTPLTPPLRHLDFVERTGFLADGRRIFTSGSISNTFVWELPLENRPLTDIAKLARLLSPNVQGIGGEPSASPSSLQSLWKELRASYPANFTITDEEIVGWHAFQAKDAELEKKWFAAVFHLEWLRVHQPEDQALLNLLAQAREHLQMEMELAEKAK